MRTLGFAVTDLIAWVGFTYKLIDLTRDRHNPFLRALVTTLFFLSLVFLLGWPPIMTRLEQHTGVLGVWSNATTELALASYQVTLLLWTYPSTVAWRKIWRRLPLYAFAVMATITLAVLGRPYALHHDIAAYAQQPELLWGQIPFVAESAALLNLVQALTTIDATLHIRRYVRLANRRWVRRGLLLIAVSNAFSLLYSLAILLVIASVRVGVTVTALARLAPGLSVIALFTATLGVTMPSWGPRVDRFRAYRRLHPLWHALYLAVPDVVLNPPRALWLDRWNPVDIHHRLYRRIIEIRDARLALRSYLDPEIVEDARGRVELTGLGDLDRRAAIEAAALAAAIKAKVSGTRPATRVLERADVGGDLAEELVWFSHVALAFQRATDHAGRAVSSDW